MTPANALTQICTSMSPWFSGCGLLFQPDPRRRSTLCHSCKRIYGRQLRDRIRDARVETCDDQMATFPEHPTFDEAVRIPILILEPVFSEGVLMSGRYSTHGNKVEIRPHWRAKGEEHDNAPFIDWFDIETGTECKELKVTGLWIEKRGDVPSYLSGRIADSHRALRIEIHRQGDVYAAFYCHG